MSISFIDPLAAGNAIRGFMTWPDGATYVRVLKAASDIFTTHDDLSQAVIAYEGDQSVFVDISGLQNGTPVFYKPFYNINGTSWLAGDTASGTPVASYDDLYPDVLTLVRERLELGLKEEVSRGVINHDRGYVQVFSAPPSLEQNIEFPVVTITLESEEPSERGIGEDIIGDSFNVIDDEWNDAEGWLANVRLSIVAWSLNSDERVALRKALRRIIIANMTIFEAFGIVMPEVHFSDVDAISGEFSINLYQVMATFSCTAPVVVGRTYTADSNVNEFIITAASLV